MYIYVHMYIHFWENLNEYVYSRNIREQDSIEIAMFSEDMSTCMYTYLENTYVHMYIYIY